MQQAKSQLNLLFITDKRRTKDNEPPNLNHIAIGGNP